MRGLIDRFLSTLSLVCRLPVPCPRRPDYRRTDFFLPIIGILAAASAWLGSMLGSLILPGSSLAQALGALGLQYLVFNLFHLDGLLDSADALLPIADRERRLAILKDSRIGGYAFAVGLFMAAIKILALSKVLDLTSASSGLRLAAFAYPVAGRSAAALVPLSSKPARKEGLGSLMVGFSLPIWAAGSALALAPFAAAAAFAPRVPLGIGAAALYGVGTVSAACSGLAVSAAYRKKIGGFTGDTLGAAVEIGESAFLVAGLALLSRLAA